MRCFRWHTKTCYLWRWCKEPSEVLATAAFTVKVCTKINQLHHHNQRIRLSMQSKPTLSFHVEVLLHKTDAACFTVYSSVLYVPAGNCCICRLMTEGGFSDPRCHTHRHSSAVASATRCSQRGPRWKSLQQSDSVSAGISGQLGHKYSSLPGSPRLTFYHHNCHSLSHSPSSSLWLHVRKC